MSLFMAKRVDPQIYDPAKRGEMTDEERREYNRKLIDSIPPRDTKAQTDRLYYMSYIMQGKPEEAEQYKAGRDKDIAWEQYYEETMSKVLKTKEEWKAIRARRKESDKQTKEIFKEEGLGRNLIKELDKGLDKMEKKIEKTII